MRVDPVARDRLLAGKKILVTGAAGFLGTHLCRRLLAMKLEVHAVSRSSVDLADPAATRSLLRRLRPDVIFHLAGMAAAGRDPDLVLPTFRANLVSTVNLLTTALEAGAPRVVLPGSMEEPDGAQADASSPYAMSKWGASAYGRMFHRLYGLPVAIGRIFITYGPTARDLHKLIPYVALSLLAGRRPTLGSGRRKVDWIYIDDVVDGLLALATAPGAVGRTLDLGTGSLVSIRDVVERIAGLIDPHGKLAPRFDPELDRSQEQVRKAEVKRTTRHLDWRPATDLDQGLALTVDGFRRQRRAPQSAAGLVELSAAH